jgi:hypothetical protein
MVSLACSLVLQAGVGAIKELGPQLGAAAALHTVLGLLNRRSRALGDTAARQVGGWVRGNHITQSGIRVGMRTRGAGDCPLQSA